MKPHPPLPPRGPSGLQPGVWEQAVLWRSRLWPRAPWALAVALVRLGVPSLEALTEAQLKQLETTPGIGQGSMLRLRVRRRVPTRNTTEGVLTIGRLLRLLHGFPLDLEVRIDGRAAQSVRLENQAAPAHVDIL